MTVFAACIINFLYLKILIIHLQDCSRHMRFFYFYNTLWTCADFKLLNNFPYIPFLRKIL